MDRLSYLPTDIDIDGDAEDDLSVALTIEGIINQDDGWGIETENGGPLGLVPLVTGLWINPTFQWKVSAIDQSDPLWDSLEHLEVSLMKGLAFDITFDDSETYALVVDTRFTQPPHEFTVGVGIERIEFNVNPIDQATFLASLLFGGHQFQRFISSLDNRTILRTNHQPKCF